MFCLTKRKFLQKVKITGGPNFFPQRRNFYPGLAEKFCKELATLSQPRPFLKIWTKSDGITPKSLFFLSLLPWSWDIWPVSCTPDLQTWRCRQTADPVYKCESSMALRKSKSSRKTNLRFCHRYNFLSVFFAVQICVKMQIMNQTLIPTQPRKGGNLKPAHKCRWFLKKETFETQRILDCLLHVYDIFWNKEPAFLELLKAVADNVELVRGDEDVLVLLDWELEGELFCSLRNRTGHTATKVVPCSHGKPWWE